MERLGILISKLQEQYNAKALPDQLQVTLQMIQQELYAKTVQQPSLKSKIAVVMPAGMNRNAGMNGHKQETHTSVVSEKPVPPTEKSPEPIPVINEEKQEKEEIRSDEKKEVSLHKEEATHPHMSAQPFKAEAPQPEEPAPTPSENAVPPKEDPVPQRQESPYAMAGVPETIAGNASAPPYDPILDVPTLSHQKEVAELNDIIAARVESLNEKLKSVHQKELGMVLNDAPVRDLKKAIGVNDRFAYISELFRGDEVMYERSLKTINNFHIYPEAEYWMERELKIKLGWDEHHPAVKQFYQLVQRRFSSI